MKTMWTSSNRKDTEALMEQIFAIDAKFNLTGKAGHAKFFNSMTTAAWTSRTEEAAETLINRITAIGAELNLTGKTMRLKPTRSVKKLLKISHFVPPEPPYRRFTTPGPKINNAGFLPLAINDQNEVVVLLQATKNGKLREFNVSGDFIFGPNLGAFWTLFIDKIGFYNWSSENRTAIFGSDQSHIVQKGARSWHNLASYTLCTVYFIPIMYTPIKTLASIIKAAKKPPDEHPVCALAWVKLKDIVTPLHDILLNSRKTPFYMEIPTLDCASLDCDHNGLFDWDNFDVTFEIFGDKNASRFCGEVRTGYIDNAPDPPFSGNISKSLLNVLIKILNENENTHISLFNVQQQ